MHAAYLTFNFIYNSPPFKFGPIFEKESRDGFWDENFSQKFTPFNFGPPQMIKHNWSLSFFCFKLHWCIKLCDANIMLLHPTRLSIRIDTRAKTGVTGRLTAPQRSGSKRAQDMVSTHP